MLQDRDVPVDDPILKAAWWHCEFASTITKIGKKVSFSVILFFELVKLLFHHYCLNYGNMLFIFFVYLLKIGPRTKKSGHPCYNTPRAMFLNIFSPAAPFLVKITIWWDQRLHKDLCNRHKDQNLEAPLHFSWHPRVPRNSGWEPMV
jgi:hypothetical protein